MPELLRSTAESGRTVITRHLKNIFDEQELDEEVVIAKIATTTQHGAISGKTQTKETNFYNLNASPACYQ